MQYSPAGFGSHRLPPRITKGGAGRRVYQSVYLSTSWIDSFTDWGVAVTQQARIDAVEALRSRDCIAAGLLAGAQAVILHRVYWYGAVREVTS